MLETLKHILSASTGRPKLESLRSLQDLTQLLLHAKNILILTGAGVINHISLPLYN